MIENIQENLLNTQLPLTNQGTSATENISKSALKNAYSQGEIGLFDESDISDEAISLYAKEQEINRYKGYLDDISQEEADNRVFLLMQQGIINFSDEELADSMLSDLQFLSQVS